MPVPFTFARLNALQQAVKIPTVISLNGQHILVWNALHVPGLVVPLYSLWAHFTQHGCGFLGASDVGILVYFLTFVLSVNTLKDCHLNYKSLGCSAPPNSLHYV
jgi:hypothetical protein